MGLVSFETMIVSSDGKLIIHPQVHEFILFRTIGKLHRS